MTLTAGTATRSPLAPLTWTVDAIRRLHGDKPVAGLVLSPEGEWIEAARFVDGTALPELLAGPRDRWAAPPHAAAALAWKAYTYWASLPAVLSFAAARRVPLLTPSNVLVRLGDEAPFMSLALRTPAVCAVVGDPIAGDPGVRVVADERALLDVLITELVDAHLAPLLTRFQDVARLGRRTLWGSLASAIAQSLRYAAGVLPEPALDTARVLLSSLALDDLVDVDSTPDGDLTVRRRTCCLAFTVPALKTCTTCCIPS